MKISRFTAAVAMAAAVVTTGAPAMAVTPGTFRANGIIAVPGNQYQDGITTAPDKIRAGFATIAAAATTKPSTIEPKDPTCGYLVTPTYIGGGSKIYTEAPKCGQKVRAVVNCLYTGGAAKVWGNILTTAGYSTAMCGSTAEVAQRGYQIYANSKWQSITWYNCKNGVCGPYSSGSGAHKHLDALVVDRLPVAQALLIRAQ